MSRSAAASNASAAGWNAATASPSAATGERPGDDDGPCRLDAEPPRLRRDRRGAAPGRERVEEILDQVALGQPLDQLQALEAERGLRRDRVREVARVLARAPVLREPRDQEAHHLVARDQRRDERGAHRGGAPERAGEHRGERAAVGLRALQLAAQLGQGDDVGTVGRTGRGCAHAQPVAARLEQVDPQRLGPEQAERLLDGDCEQVVDRLGARDVPSELRQLLELAQRAAGALVEPRVLDRVGHERGDVQQERGVLRAEHARGLGVQRDHADHALALGDQRDGDERLVLLLLELGEVLDARVGERLLRDEHGLRVLEHPACDALARRHRDATAEVRVALRGRAQHDAPAAVLAQEDVGRVRDDRVVDEPHDRTQHLLEIERRVDGVDDLVEDAELVLLRRTRAVGCWYGRAQGNHQWMVARVRGPEYVQVAHHPAARGGCIVPSSRRVCTSATSREYGGDPRAARDGRDQEDVGGDRPRTVRECPGAR